jgi:hypothetical protein
MNKKDKILFFCMIIVNHAVLAQTATAKTDNLLLLELAKSAVAMPVSLPVLQINTNHPKPFLSPQYYSAQLGFFCKQEIKFDKITRIPFRFRLGSVEQCDRLEGKGKQ